MKFVIKNNTLNYKRKSNLCVMFSKSGLIKSFIKLFIAIKK